MGYKLVIFDLDGTLLDTIEDLAEAVNHALQKRGLPLHSLDEYRGMVGHGVRNLVTQALERSLSGCGGAADGRSDGSGAVAGGRVDCRSSASVDEVLADFKEYYCGHIDVHTHPYPGMAELVKDLHAAGVRMAVASNKFQSGTEKLVHEFFPGIPFVAILGNREGFPLKPDPEIVREAIRAAGEADAVLVGDSRTDMQTAANGGIPAIAVGWGYRPMGASYQWQYAADVTELRNLLLGKP